jgi:hypothetical protein
MRSQPWGRSVVAHLRVLAEVKLDVSMNMACYALRWAIG